MERVLQLDDAVIWGSLSQVSDSKDALISSFARRLQDRKLFKCIDIRMEVEHEINPEHKRSDEIIEEIDKRCECVLSRLNEVVDNVNKPNVAPAILLDSGSRSAYKMESGSQGPLERINVKTGGGALLDLRQRSRVVAGIGDFKFTRAYFNPDCTDAKRTIDDAIQQEIEE